jgi:hypothetical protein
VTFLSIAERWRGWQSKDLELPFWGKLNESNLKIPAPGFEHALDKDRNSRTQHNNHSPKPPPGVSAPY